MRSGGQGVRREEESRTLAGSMRNEAVVDLGVSRPPVSGGLAPQVAPQRRIRPGQFTSCCLIRGLRVARALENVRLKGEAFPGLQLANRV